MFWRNPLSTPVYNSIFAFISCLSMTSKLARSERLRLSRIFPTYAHSPSHDLMWVHPSTSSEVCQRFSKSPMTVSFLRSSLWELLSFFLARLRFYESEKWKWSRSVISDSLGPHGLQPTSLLCPWDFPGKEYWRRVPLPCPIPINNSLNGSRLNSQMTEWPNGLKKKTKQNN